MSILPSDWYNNRVKASSVLQVSRDPTNRDPPMPMSQPTISGQCFLLSLLDAWNWKRERKKKQVGPSAPPLMRKPRQYRQSGRINRAESQPYKARKGGMHVGQFQNMYETNATRDRKRPTRPRGKKQNIKKEKGRRKFHWSLIPTQWRINRERVERVDVAPVASDGSFL